MFTLNRSDVAVATTASQRLVFDIPTQLAPELAFDVVAGHEHEAEWFPDFVSAEWLTPEPHGVGSLRLFRMKAMTVLEEFLVWDRGQRLTFRLNECSLPLLADFIEDYEFAARPEGGYMLRWTVAYNPNPWIAFLHPLVGPFFRKDFEKAARQLRVLLDRLAAASPSA